MSYIKKLIAMVLTFAMTLSMASIATIQAMQSPIEFNKSKTYAVISTRRRMTAEVWVFIPSFWRMLLLP